VGETDQPLLESVVAIWGDVFGSDVRPTDDFFQIGGESALAVRLASRIRGTLGFDVPTSAIFEAATPEGLAARLANGLQAARGPEPRSEEATRAFPLTVSQERIWWLEQVIPTVSGFHTRARLELEGELDVAALTLSLTEIVRRHDILRSRFEVVDGSPRGVVRPDVELQLDELELHGLDPVAEKAELDRLSLQQARRPFDLVGEPLLRLLLVRCAPDRYVLLVATHHIAFDGWSRDVFVREVAELYAAYAGGDESPLPDLPVQYGDFAAWQREHFTGPVLDEELGYWRDRLGGDLRPLELGASSRATATGSTFRSSDIGFSLGPGLAAEAAELAHSEGASIYMLLLAAFTSVLHAYSGSRDVRVASLVANRVWPNTQDLIGLFANIVVLRNEVDPAATFRELLHGVRETALGAYRHQSLPFESVLSALDLDATVDRRALLQFGLAVHVPAPPRRGLPGVRMRLIRELAQRDEGDEESLNPSTFDLTLELVETGGSYVGKIEYSRDAFDRTLVARFAADLGRAVETAVRAPDTRVGELL
jgi:Condensation domain/Phosphopantetheine attachment site